MCVLKLIHVVCGESYSEHRGCLYDPAVTAADIDHNNMNNIVQHMDII